MTTKTFWGLELEKSNESPLFGENLEKGKKLPDLLLKAAASSDNLEGSNFERSNLEASSDCDEDGGKKSPFEDDDDDNDDERASWGLPIPKFLMTSAVFLEPDPADLRKRFELTLVDATEG